jgi:hypothetical protein
MDVAAAQKELEGINRRINEVSIGSGTGVGHIFPRSQKH